MWFQGDICLEKSELYQLQNDRPMYIMDIYVDIYTYI